MTRNPYRAASPRRSTLAVTLAATAAIGAAALAGPARAAEPAAANPAASRAAAGNVVVEWNRTLLSLVQTPGAQPATIQPTRDFAVMSAAVYDAVDAIDPDHPQYLLRLKAGRGASPDAAAAQAAHDVLTAIFPTFADRLDQQLATDLATIGPSWARTAGIRAGTEAAAGLLQARAADGSTTPPPPYRSTGAAGDYRPTPPGFAAPVFTHWGAVTPFVLTAGDQFRPPPPAALNSPAYAAAINEVKSLGRDTSTTRTVDQTTIGKFWAAPIQNYWNAIADQVALAHHDDTDTAARTFALLDLGLADATIALYDAKYAYRLWRPISAIRLADTDGNPLTSADPAWTPLATTPPDPSYPGAHSTLSAAAATVLTALYGDHVAFTVASPTLPGVTRSFDNFHDAATEAGLSRIYAGIHTRLDHQAGLTLGSQVGRDTLHHALSHDHH
jgi:membrane-associated phospholipid phosphatase